MKKSTKILAATLAVLPCALVLTACGGNKNKPLIENYKDTDITYTETTFETFTQEIESRGEGVLKGIKAKTNLSLELTTDMSGLGNVPGLPTEPVTETLELENTTVASGLGVDEDKKISSEFSMNYNDEKYNAQAYYTDETFFVDLTGLNLKDNLGDNYVEGIDKFSYSLAQTQAYTTDSETYFNLDLAALLAMLDDSDYAGFKDQVLLMTTWSSSKTDTSYKVKITFDGEQISEFVSNLITSNTELGQLDMLEEVNITTLNIYLIYGETTLDAVALDFEGSVKLNVQGIKYDASLKLNTEAITTTEEAKLPDGLTTEKYPALDPSIFEGFIPAN